MKAIPTFTNAITAVVIGWNIQMCSDTSEPRSVRIYVVGDYVNHGMFIFQTTAKLQTTAAIY